jgi:ATP-dependent DNA ligase
LHPRGDQLEQTGAFSCIIDGEAVGCEDNGVASFDRVRYRHHDESIFLIELNSDDLRRKLTLEPESTIS